MQEKFYRIILLHAPEVIQAYSYIFLTLHINGKILLLFWIIYVPSFGRVKHVISSAGSASWQDENWYDCQQLL